VKENQTEMRAPRLGQRFTDAVAYAAKVHADQRRKGTNVPYIGHLLGVTSIVIDAGGTENEAIAAVLHDAPEDRGGRERLNDIRARFGSTVAAIIEGCSDPLGDGGKDESKTYDERKAAYLAHLRSCNDRSVYLVSVADKLHNARATLLDVRSEGTSVWQRFNAPRDVILTNYDRLVAAYDDGPEDNRRIPLVDELRRTVAELKAISGC
jgi:(p)ppGpp synthase/HD superfamily hydrolase